MTKGLQRSLSRGPKPTAPVNRLDVAINKLVAIEGTTGVGYGTVVLAGLPEGNILVHGIILDLDSMTRLGTNISATFLGDIGLGTTPLDDGTISVGDEDLITEVTTTIAVAGVAPAKRYTSPATISDVIIDNTAADLEINLNILVDDADIADDDSLTVVGNLHMTYTVLGDD